MGRLEPANPEKENPMIDCSAIYFQCMSSIERARAAYHYERGTLSAEDAQRMTYDLQQISGWYHLMMLARGDVMDEAIGNAEEDVEGRWKPHPELPALVDEACEYVAECWEADYSEARNWALDRVEELADQRGIELEPIEEAEDEAGICPDCGGSPDDDTGPHESFCPHYTAEEAE